jgi:hypothetical protein
MANTTIIPIPSIWTNFVNYTFTSCGDSEDEKKDTFTMFVMEHEEDDDEEQILNMYGIGRIWAIKAMCYLQEKYCLTNKMVDIKSKLYRFTYFTYLRESEGELVSQSRIYEINDADWLKKRSWPKNQDIIVVSWLRANMAARRIQRHWRKRRWSAALVIQKMFREAISNPNYTLCKKRLLREAHSLII